ncbi:MAG: hypothetical protein U0R64_11290 [Candidatus Nanopelagicales bacterium]
MTPDDPTPAADRESRFGVGTAVIVACCGVVLALFGGFLQAVMWGWFPIGAVVVLGCLVACIRALVHLFDSRRPAIVLMIGWAATSVLLAIPTAAGDIVIARDPVAIGYLFAGVVVGTACCNVPARLRPVAPA